MKIKMAIIAAILIFFNLNISYGCEFVFSIVSEHVDEYHVGDEVIIEVQIHLTHRSCHEAADATKFQIDGFEIKGTTQWKQISPTVYSRKIKAVILETSGKTSKIYALRSCDKDGGSGTFELDLI